MPTSGVKNSQIKFMSVRTFLTFIFPLFSLFVSAQETVRYPTFKVDGVMKNKFEYALKTQKTRFSVRNSRLGIRGSFTDVFTYRGQVELSDNGNFRVLDLYGAFVPLEGLSVSLGQVSIPLFNSYIVSPGRTLFANRAFLGKYFLGTRDIGIHADYNFRMGSIPASVEFGVFNGNKSNDPVWSERLSWGGRFELGEMEGFRSTAKIYDYPKASDTHYLFYGADLRYQGDNWRVETEFIKRDNKQKKEDGMLSCYLQGAYVFPLRETFFFKHITPAFRWDSIDKHPKKKGFDVNRLTLGLGFGLTKKYFASVLRFDYERYWVNNELDILNLYQEMDSDKFTVELLLTF